MQSAFVLAVFGACPQANLSLINNKIGLWELRDKNRLERSKYTLCDNIYLVVATKDEEDFLELYKHHVRYFVDFCLCRPSFSPLARYLSTLNFKRFKRNIWNCLFFNCIYLYKIEIPNGVLFLLLNQKIFCFVNQYWVFCKKKTTGEIVRRFYFASRDSFTLDTVHTAWQLLVI